MVSFFLCIQWCLAGPGWFCECRSLNRVSCPCFHPLGIIQDILTTTLVQHLQPWIENFILNTEMKSQEWQLEVKKREALFFSIYSGLLTSFSLLNCVVWTWQSSLSIGLVFLLLAVWYSLSCSIGKREDYRPTDLQYHQYSFDQGSLHPFEEMLLILLIDQIHSLWNQSNPQAR